MLRLINILVLLIAAILAIQTQQHQPRTWIDVQDQSISSTVSLIDGIVQEKGVARARVLSPRKLNSNRHRELPQPVNATKIRPQTPPPQAHRAQIQELESEIYDLSSSEGIQYRHRQRAPQPAPQHRSKMPVIEQSDEFFVPFPYYIPAGKPVEAIINDEDGYEYESIGSWFNLKPERAEEAKRPIVIARSPIQFK